MNGLRSALFLTPWLFATSASAQFSDFWAEFVPAPEMISTPFPISSPATETDLAWADLDGNGTIDLVVARKEPIIAFGKRPNFLMMNQSGVLTNETQALASQSDVPGAVSYTHLTLPTIYAV